MTGKRRGEREMGYDIVIIFILICGALLTIDGMLEEKKWACIVGLCVFIVGLCLLIGYLFG